MSSHSSPATPNAQGLVEQLSLQAQVHHKELLAEGQLVAEEVSCDLLGLDELNLKFSC